MKQLSSLKWMLSIILKLVLMRPLRNMGSPSRVYKQDVDPDRSFA